MGRPLVAALQQQQETIEGLRRTVAKQDLIIDYIANLAGVSKQVTAIRKKADIDNPAQPVPNPPSQPATETTEQAATAETVDSPLVPGQTPGSVQDLPADTTGTPMDPGTTLPTAPYNNLVDVQAPVAGTETHVPNEQTRTEVDVRVGDPMNLERAFPWGIGPDAQGQATASRSMASMRLAELRLAAGIAEGDRFQVSAKIEGDRGLSDEAIAHEINTLASVTKAAARRTQRPANAVPRPAGGVQRTTPSLVGGAGLTAEASVAADVDDCGDLFD